MGVLNLVVSTSRDTGYLTNNFETAGGARAIAQRVVDYVQRIASGNELGSPPSIAISIRANQLAATGSFVFSGVPSANDTCTINGVPFTVVDSGATGNQFNKGASLTEAAANLAAVVNASASALVSGYVAATTPVAGTCLITSSFYGNSGNQVTTAKSGSNISVTGTRLTGGAEDASAQTLNF